jgi:hypothetical protein
MEDQPDRSSAVTMPVKLGRLGKFDIRSQNKRTIYNVDKFFKEISEQPEHFSNINVHKTQEITVKACGVHHSTLQKVCNEAFNSLSDNQVFVSPRKPLEQTQESLQLLTGSKRRKQWIQPKPEQSCLSVFNHSRHARYMNWTK